MTAEGAVNRRISATSQRKKRGVVVVGDFLLRETEIVMCGPDRMSQEVCFLLAQGHQAKVVGLFRGAHSINC